MVFLLLLHAYRIQLDLNDYIFNTINFSKTTFKNIVEPTLLLLKKNEKMNSKITKRSNEYYNVKQNDTARTIRQSL